jgi:hypothetical protein
MRDDFAEYSHYSPAPAVVTAMPIGSSGQMCALRRVIPFRQVMNFRKIFW